MSPLKTLPRIYVIRHGETEWSLSGRHTGRTEIALTAHGEDEARELGQRLQHTPFTRVWTSPRQRARRTCELAEVGAVPEIEPDLAEWDYGDFEGKLSADVVQARPGWNLFQDGCPGGESPAQVSDRADRVIARLRTLEGNVALFTHGHFGRVLGMRWIGLPVSAAQHFLLSTASLSVLGYEHDRADQPAISLWNAAPHEMFGPAPESRTGDTPAMRRRAVERWENEGGEVPKEPRSQTDRGSGA